jgi:glycosyltransferase involved in cell wall biosynthesis
MIVASVVIPSYGRPSELRLAVLSALAQNFDASSYEMLVVDSSPDGRNREVVEELQASARCELRFLQKRPEGPGPSRNFGAREGRGAIIAFLDSDCEASPGWLQAGVAAFADGVGIVQGRTQPDPAVRPHVLNTCIDVPTESFVYQSANIFYRRAAFEEVGGFVADQWPDEMRPLGGEDLEMAWAVKKRGWKSIFAPDALVTHPVRRMSLLQWIFPRRLAVFARCAHNYPEIRRFFFLRYFFDEAQGYFALAMAGLATAWLSPWALLITLPYLVFRGGKPSMTLRGPLRVLRLFLYLPRDAATFLILCAGSVRFRALLL